MGERDHQFRIPGRWRSGIGKFYVLPVFFIAQIV